jgi:hypothetical protein
MHMASYVVATVVISLLDFIKLPIWYCTFIEYLWLCLSQPVADHVIGMTVSLLLFQCAVLLVLLLNVLQSTQ